MSVIEEVTIKPSETPEEYRIRLYRNREAYGLNNTQIGDLCNAAFGVNWDESAHRKKAKNFIEGFDVGYKKGYADGVEKFPQAASDELDQLRAERIKIQTLNLEKNRITRKEQRHVLYHEYLSHCVERLEMPEIVPIGEKDRWADQYLLTISDIHFGANFVSENNIYNIKECTSRFNILLSRTIHFIEEHQLKYLKVACLGDTIQGMLRIKDVGLNESSVVSATVQVSRLIAKFLNQLSAYVEIDYYHVPVSNHTQLRPLGTKASELAAEDMEYVIGNYIKDLLRDNYRVEVHLEFDSPYIEIPIFTCNVIAMHGHTIKNLSTALKDLSTWIGKTVDCLILGHYHQGAILPGNETRLSDTEVILCPSIVGSCPYSDSLMRGTKAASQILKFNSSHGYVGYEKIILN